MHRRKEKTSEEDARTMIWRRVVARSSGRGSSKKAWTKPPSEVVKPRTPAKPRVAEQIGLIASVVANAAATACETAWGGAATTACATALGGPAPSTQEPANPVLRVSASGEKPPRVDVAGPRSLGQRPWGGPGSDGRPKSVNQKGLAPGSKADASDSGVAAHGLGDSTRSPMSMEAEDMIESLSTAVFGSDFERDMEEDAEERRAAAGQFCGIQAGSAPGRF